MYPLTQSLRLGSLARTASISIGVATGMKECATPSAPSNARCWRTSVLPRTGNFTGPRYVQEAVCVVFEKVNTGGKALDAFELVTAMYAAEGHELRKDWYGNDEHKE